MNFLLIFALIINMLAASVYFGCFFFSKTQTAKSMSMGFFMFFTFMTLFLMLNAIGEKFLGS